MPHASARPCVGRPPLLPRHRAAACPRTFGRHECVSCDVIATGSTSDDETPIFLHDGPLHDCLPHRSAVGDGDIGRRRDALRGVHRRSAVRTARRYRGHARTGGPCRSQGRRRDCDIRSARRAEDWAESGVGDHSKLKSKVPPRPVQSRTGRSTPVEGFVKKPAIRETVRFFLLIVPGRPHLPGRARCYRKESAATALGTSMTALAPEVQHLVPHRESPSWAQERTIHRPNALEAAARLLPLWTARDRTQASSAFQCASSA